MTGNRLQNLRNVWRTTCWLAVIAGTVLVLCGAFVVSRPAAAVQAQVEPLLGELVPADFVSFAFEASISDGKQRCHAVVDSAEANRRHIPTFRGVAQLVGYLDLPAGEKPLYFYADKRGNGEWSLTDALIRPGQVSTAVLHARIEACLPLLQPFGPG